MQGGATNKYSLFRAYFLLSKARLSMLVASTASAGYVLGSGSDVDWAQLGYTTLGTFLAAGTFCLTKIPLAFKYHAFLMT